MLSAEATVSRYGLCLAQTIGCNMIIANSDNLKLINTKNEAGRSVGLAALLFDDRYHIACSFRCTLLASLLSLLASSSLSY